MLSDDKLSRIISEAIEIAMGDLGLQALSETQFYSKCYLNSFANEFRLKLRTDLRGNELTSRIHVILNRMGIKPDSNGQYSRIIIKQLLSNVGGKLDVFREYWRNEFETNLPKPERKAPSPYAYSRRRGESAASAELLRGDD